MEDRKMENGSKRKLVEIAEDTANEINVPYQNHNFIKEKNLIRDQYLKDLNSHLPRWIRQMVGLYEADLRIDFRRET